MKLISNGTFDAYINAFSNRLKQWLAGPDGIYGNDDDRRAYLRLGMSFHRIDCFFRTYILGSALSLDIEEPLFVFEFE